jgi:D-glycero-alpha-D-manno-heptose 1-phosphate guanylyltransferase
MRPDTKAVLLVGGLGTRLRSVLPGTPKALASVGNCCFLDLLIGQLRNHGIRQIVMCTGHLAEQIENRFGDGRAWGVMIEYSKESEPLGTGGAVKLAERYLSDVSDFLVMNGDSFLEVDFDEFITFHAQHHGLISIAVWRTADAARFGTVQIGAGNRITAFAEKASGHSFGLINGGVYVFNHAVLDQIPKGPSSLEKDVFPQLISHGVYGLEQHGIFIDIGTPEDYALVQPLSERLNQAALRGATDQGRLVLGAEEAGK